MSNRRPLLSTLSLALLVWTAIPAPAVLAEPRTTRLRPLVSEKRSPQSLRFRSGVAAGSFNATRIQKGDADVELVLDPLDERPGDRNYIFNTDPAFRFAAANRFTLRPEQSPFSLESVETVFLARQHNDNADIDVGFSVGDEVEIAVLGDPAGSGDPVNARYLGGRTWVVNQTDTLESIPLETPITIPQGDVYVAVVDTRPDTGVASAYVSFEAGPQDPGYRRGFIADASAARDGAAFTALSTFDLEHIFVIRAVGKTGSGGSETGGGQDLDADLPSPQNLVVASGNAGLTLNWSPPNVESAPPPGEDDVEPELMDVHNTHATAQELGEDPFLIVKGKDRSGNNGGEKAGYCAQERTPDSADDVEDWYAFELTGTAEITIRLEKFGNTDFDLFLYQATGPFTTCPEDNRTSGRIDDSGNAAGVNEQIGPLTRGAGRYFIGVAAFDPGNGVPNDTSYELTVVTKVGISGYNVFQSADADVGVDDTFVIFVGGNTTSVTLPAAAGLTNYAITAVYGDRQSPPSNTAATITCGEGSSIAHIDTVYQISVRDSLLITGSGFEPGAKVLLDGKEFRFFAKVSRNGTRIRQRDPLKDGDTIENVCRDGCTVVILNPSGTCAVSAVQ